MATSEADKTRLLLAAYLASNSTTITDLAEECLKWRDTFPGTTPEDWRQSIQLAQCFKATMDTLQEKLSQGGLKTPADLAQLTSAVGIAVTKLAIDTLPFYLAGKVVAQTAPKPEGPVQ